MRALGSRPASLSLHCWLGASIRAAGEAELMRAGVLSFGAQLPALRSPFTRLCCSSVVRRPAGIPVPPQRVLLTHARKSTRSSYA